MIYDKTNGVYNLQRAQLRRWMAQPGSSVPLSQWDTSFIWNCKYDLAFIQPGREGRLSSLGLEADLTFRFEKVYG